MVVRYYKTLWGMGGTLDEKLAKIKAAGYDGFEDWIKPHFELKPAIEKAGIRYMAMVGGANPEQFKRDLGEAVDCGADGATIHVGSAAMSYEQGLDLLGKLVELTKGVPFPVNFETHRGRLLNEPLSTERYLKALPDLWLCADFSHWCVVTESMLGGFGDAMKLAVSRTRHIHARIGFEEGPQVPDPRLPAWEEKVKVFEGWWDQIRASHVARNAPFLTVDPEFGPPHYQWTNPATGEPLADIWDVSLWMTNRLRERWAKQASGADGAAPSQKR